MSWLIRLLVTAGAVFLAAALVPGVSLSTGIVDLAVVAALFALVNLLVRPVLTLLSLPFIVLTLGLFLLVVNAALFGLTAALTDRLSVDGFGAAVLAGLVVSVASWIGETALGVRRS